MEIAIDDHAGSRFRHFDHRTPRTRARHRRARGAARPRHGPEAGSSKSSEKLRRGRRPSEGLAFVARDAAGAARRHGAAVGCRAGRGRPGRAAARPARRRSGAKGAGVGSALMQHADRRGAPARPSGDPAGRRCALLCALRLLGARRPAAGDARPLRAAPASWRWNWRRARLTARRARSRRPAARRRRRTVLRRCLSAGQPRPGAAAGSLRSADELAERHGDRHVALDLDLAGHERHGRVEIAGDQRLRDRRATA